MNTFKQQSPDDWNLLQALSSLKTKWLLEGSDVPKDDDTAGKGILNLVGALSPQSYMIPPVHQKRMCHIYTIMYTYS